MERPSDLAQPHAYRELSALYRIAALSTARADMDEMIDEILRVVTDVVVCDRPVLYLLSEDERALQTFEPGAGGRSSLPLEEPSIPGRLLQTGRAELIENVRTDPDANRRVAAGDDRQMLATPLSMGGRAAGVLTAIRARGEGFTPSDLQLLSVIADRVALAIENRRLVERLQRQVQELDGVHRLARLLGSGESIDHAVGEAVGIVAELLSCDRAVVLLPDDDDGATLVPRGPAFGLDEPQREQMRTPLSKPSLIATVFRTSTPLVTNDARSDSWVSRRLRDALDVEALLVVPLTAAPRSIGVLVAADPRKGYFDENDIRYTALLGASMGSVIESSRARERERALMTRLRDADRMKTEFVSMLAHELRGPMATVKGFADSLREHWDSVSDERRDQILEIVSKEIERLARLTADLLDVSRMEAGSLRYDIEPMSFSDLVDSVLTVHTSLSDKHALVSEVPSDLPKVLGDKDRLRQVLLNLLTNATRYSPEGSTVTISSAVVTRDGGPWVAVSVADEGIGIAEDDRDRIFGKFSMVPKPEWVNKGTGLGLFITKGIVETHGGEVWVDSEVGRGSTFHFTLPLSTDAARA